MRRDNFAYAFVIVLLGASLLVSTGCEQSNPAAEAGPKAKMDFHKPKDFSLAVTRLREIHNQLTSDDSLPDPISYTVVEFSHSHGEGKSHVHYRLVDENEDHSHGGHDHSHHEHQDASEAPVKHKIVVDVFTEIHDISRWLPGIASDGDMPENDWNQVKEISKTMTEHLAPLTEEGTPDEKRQRYQSKSSDFESSISSLEELTPKADSSAVSLAL